MCEWSCRKSEIRGCDSHQTREKWGSDRDYDAHVHRSITVELGLAYTDNSRVRMKYGAHGNLEGGGYIFVSTKTNSVDYVQTYPSKPLQP